MTDNPQPPASDEIEKLAARQKSGEHHLSERQATRTDRQLQKPDMPVGGKPKLHRSDRQATVTDNRAKPPSDVPGKSQLHPSDQQTTSADQQPKPPEKATDKQSLVKRINQWEELSKSEKSRLNKVIAEEKIPEGKLFSQEDPSLDHLMPVVDAVNLALSRSNPPSLEGKQSVQDRLEAARQYITEWRGESKTHSESLILRDAERYLWARSGVGEFAREKFYGSISAARTLAEAGYGWYEVGKIASIITGSDYAKTNKNLPFSARGGHDWWSLGLQHWDRFDKDSLNSRGDIKHLTYEDVIRFKDGLARIQEDDDFNPAW